MTTESMPEKVYQIREEDEVEETITPKKKKTEPCHALKAFSSVGT